MNSSPRTLLASVLLVSTLAPTAFAQDATSAPAAAPVAPAAADTAPVVPIARSSIGTRFPSEKKIYADPVTGVPVTFLTSSGGSKIYQTHHQWTSDGKWLIIHSNLVPGQAMAVNEETGEMVQVSDKGYSGMLCLADHSMNLYFLRTSGRGRGAATAATSAGPAAAATDLAASAPPATTPAAAAPADATAPANPVAATDTPAPARGTGGRRGGAAGARGPGRGPSGPAQIIRVDLAKLFADVAANKVGPATDYEHVCGTIPVEWGAGGDMALDCTEDYAYFRVSATEAAKHLPPDAKLEAAFGPRNMGAGPTGLGKMNLKTGEVGYIVSVPFQIGHVQTNPWVPGEIVFCWETGGKAPQRTWTVMADGTGLRPLFPEAPFDWITHEAVITKDEVAIAMLAHRNPSVTDESDWGRTSTGEHPSGVGIVNLRDHTMRIAGQVPQGDPGRSIWHVNGSPDGRWAVADDFQYRLWIIDRKNGETKLLADLGHVVGASDHIHPTFNADSNKIEVQSAMVSENGRTLNIAVVPVPESWLKRTYPEKFE